MKIFKKFSILTVLAIATATLASFSSTTFAMEQKNLTQIFPNSMNNFKSNIDTLITENPKKFNKLSNDYESYMVNNYNKNELLQNFDLTDQETNRFFLSQLVNLRYLLNLYKDYLEDYLKKYPDQRQTYEKSIDEIFSRAKILKPFVIGGNELETNLQKIYDCKNKQNQNYEKYALKFFDQLKEQLDNINNFKKIIESIKENAKLINNNNNEIKLINNNNNIQDNIIQQNWEQLEKNFKLHMVEEYSINSLFSLFDLTCKEVYNFWSKKIFDLEKKISALEKKIVFQSNILRNSNKNFSKANSFNYFLDNCKKTIEKLKENLEAARSYNNIQDENYKQRARDFFSHFHTLLERLEAIESATNLTTSPSPLTDKFNLYMLDSFDENNLLNNFDLTNKETYNFWLLKTNELNYKIISNNDNRGFLKNNLCGGNQDVKAAITRFLNNCNRLKSIMNENLKAASKCDNIQSENYKQYAINFFKSFNSILKMFKNFELENAAPAIIAPASSIKANKSAAPTVAPTSSIKSNNNINDKQAKNIFKMNEALQALQALTTSNRLHMIEKCDTNDLLNESDLTKSKTYKFYKIDIDNLLNYIKFLKKKLNTLCTLKLGEIYHKTITANEKLITDFITYSDKIKDIHGELNNMLTNAFSCKNNENPNYEKAAKDFFESLKQQISTISNYENNIKKIEQEVMMADIKDKLNDLDNLTSSQKNLQDEKTFLKYSKILQKDLVLYSGENSSQSTVLRQYIKEHFDIKSEPYKSLDERTEQATLKTPKNYEVALTEKLLLDILKKQPYAIKNNMEFNPVFKFDRGIAPIELTIDGHRITDLLENDANKDFFKLFKILLNKIDKAYETIKDVKRGLNINPGSI